MSKLMQIVCVFVAILTTLYSASLALQLFQHRIPNGLKVPHPCRPPGWYWPAVGHALDQGGGANNLFGLDFKYAGFKWTRTLCHKDSDGDGLTNGEELGDPACTWREGHEPPLGEPLGHPGFVACPW